MRALQAPGRFPAPEHTVATAALLVTSMQGPPAAPAVRSAGDERPHDVACPHPPAEHRDGRMQAGTAIDRDATLDDRLLVVYALGGGSRVSTVGAGPVRLTPRVTDQRLSHVRHICPDANSRCLVRIHATILSADRPLSGPRRPDVPNRRVPAKGGPEKVDVAAQSGRRVRAIRSLADKAPSWRSATQPPRRRTVSMTSSTASSMTSGCSRSWAGRIRSPSWLTRAG